jgi:hypothetical protein
MRWDFREDGHTCGDLRVESEDEERNAGAIRWLDETVATQGPDGNIGIFKVGEISNRRFRHQGENGELWTQSSIFQELIAGWEFAGIETWYPLGDFIRVKIDPAKLLPMKLRFRIPTDAADVKVTGISDVRRDHNYLVIDRTW